MSWLQIKKKSSFWRASYLILCSSNEPFLDRVVTCDKKWILYHNRPWPAQWLDREEAPKCVPKPNLHQKKSWSLFCGLLPVWSTIAFWIPAKPLHLRCMLSKSMRCTESCKALSQHWSIARGQFSSRTTPDCMLHNQCLKSWTNWATKFCLIWHIHLTSSQLTSTWGSRQPFAEKRFSQPGGSRKFFPRVCWIPKLGFLTYRSKQTFLIVKNVLIVMVLILINRDVLEPSCNDLKFTTWNHNYFRTNLVCNSLEVELLGQRAVYLMSFRL